MGNSQSLPSGTQFVNTEQPAVASYQQCHVFGDSNLYGVGIRTSYYLQYTAALLSLVFLRGGQDQGQKSWFLSFVPLVAANLVVLSLNAASGGGLVILDWAIVFGLVFWSIVFLAWPIFGRTKGVGGALGLVGDPKPLQQALERELGRVVGDREAEWHARYVNVLKELGLEAEGVEEKEDRHRALELALRDYVTAFTPAQFSLVSTESTSYILDLYGDGRASQVAARMMIDNKQIESFRDSHAEALRLANVPFDQAQATTMALGRLALGEIPLHEPARTRCSVRQVLMDLSYPVRAGGTVTSCGLGLLLYCGFLVFTVWALFRGVNAGARAGCNVHFVFLVVPASVYNRSAITALRVLFCIWFAVISVPIFLAGVTLLALGAMDWWRGRPSNAPRKGAPDPSAFSTVPYDAEKGKETDIASPVSPVSLTRAPRSSDAYEMDEIRTTTTSPGTARNTRGSSFFGGSIIKELEPAAGGAEIRGGERARKRRRDLGAKLLPSVKRNWTYLLALPVIHTITVVEVTIRINNLDMTTRPMSTVGEILAFFLGVFVLMRILALCAREGMRRLERSRSAGWFQERRAIVGAPANMVGDPESGRALRKEVSVGGESNFGEAKGKQRRIYIQPERKSGSSMGRFREMIDDNET